MNKVLTFITMIKPVSTLFVLCALFNGCAPDKVDTSAFEHAAAVAKDVATDSLMPLIYRLDQARQTDVHVNCTGFTERNMFPPCELTRDASVAIVTHSLETMGYTVDTVESGDASLPAYNIVAEWRGAVKPNEVVLVAGHLDAFYSGADDNSSALAVMIETARTVRLHHFSRTIRFVAFDLEEYGSIGSTRYVEAGYANDIVSGIVLECIGYTTKEPGGQHQIKGLQLPEQGDFLLCAGNENSMEIARQFTALSSMYKLTNLESVLVPGDGAFFFSSAFMRSDHGLLWLRGFPILFLTDTANFRNPNYHQKTDTPQTIDKEFLAANARAVAAMTALLAEVQP